MNERERQEVIAGYVRRLASALGDVPGATRHELLEDVRSHIEEAWAAGPQRDRAALMNILERLGPPEVVAREQRERLGIPEETERGGLLAPIAVVLTALFWPVGIVLAWLSPRWRTRDKVIATALPVLGLLIVLAVNMPAVQAYQSGPVIAHEVVTDAETAPAVTTQAPSPVSRPNALLVVLAAGSGLFGIFGAPLVAAIYLAWRLRRPAARSGGYVSYGVV